MAGRSDPQVICRVGALLGEGPVWVVREQALWFVDIKQRKVHRFTPGPDNLTSWDAPAQIGWILPARDGTMVAGLEGEIGRFDPAEGTFSPITRVAEEPAGNRLNDATSDPQGRVWFGSMDDGEKMATGQFYCIERGRVRAAGLPSVAITNGPALSPNGRILYHVDTLAGLIHACDVAEDGSLGSSRPFLRIEREEGYPDGPTVDSEGCLWIGLFSGWQARRYSPGGELLETVRFPVSNITKLSFGGPDLRTVYATTARLHLKPDQLERQPDAGHLFAFRSEVPGVPVTPAAL